MTTEELLYQEFKNLTHWAGQVMRYLEEDGASIVPHLMDTDDNPGQRLREALERARRLLDDAALPAPQAWQPIETAPRDGPRILLLVPPYGPFTGVWARSLEYPWSGRWSIPGLLNQDARPTHWMPLPPPPTETDR